MLRAARKLITAPARRVFGTVTRVDTTEPVAAITFDDGPDPRYLPPLLDLLKRYGARATFFVIGHKAQKYPDLIARLAAAGHVVGNHSFTHPSFPMLSGRARRAEIRACRAAIAPHGSELLRPPYGHQTLASRLDAMACGYQVIAWSVDVWDWLGKPPAWMADELARRTGPGDIVLLHDAIDADGNPALIEDRSAMMAGLEMFLQRSAGRLRFVTVPELLAAGRPVRKNWVRRKQTPGY